NRWKRYGRSCGGLVKRSNRCVRTRTHGPPAVLPSRLRERSQTGLGEPDRAEVLSPEIVAHLPRSPGSKKILDLVMRCLHRDLFGMTKQSGSSGQKEKEKNMYEQEIPASQVKADRFPFPCEGDITLAVRNKNYALGPVMLHIVMKPGSVIPAHLHQGVS